MIRLFRSRASIDELLSELGLEPLSSGDAGSFAERLAAFEKVLGTSLPRDYKSFVSKHPTSVFDRRIGIDVPSVEGLEFPVGLFYGFDGCDYQIEEMRDRFQDRFASHLLPIAEGFPGDQILLSLTGSNKGAIYYWDHEGSFPDAAACDDLIFLADTFDEFVRRCRPLTDDDQSTDAEPIETWYADEL